MANEIYDDFPSGQFVQPVNFTFYPSRYEIWQRGRLVRQGICTSPIQARALSDTPPIMSVSCVEPALSHDILPQFTFDAFITHDHRLMLLTIPAQTSPECMGITMMQMTIVTRETKIFEAGEPYCCSLFFQHAQLCKVTFLFSNPAKLIEFYS
ncbi:hypothetical protein [Millionella massiliensis]|uniref:hypothetical protein n=1 Tax=Millionella massiliensis TaxID=1871023 RepID=UPI0024B68BCC|nr:hypothetical protein [Millionella massiliensis]